VLPNKFCKNWNAEIAKHKNGWICGRNYATMVIFHLNDSPKYLSSGCQVAKQFGFPEPTKVVLEYTIENNLFEMKVLQKHRQQIHEPQIIEIDDSDDEAKPDANVTPRIPSSKKQRTAYNQNRIQPKVVVYIAYFYFYSFYSYTAYTFSLLLFFIYYLNCFDLPKNESTQSFQIRKQKTKPAAVEPASAQVKQKTAYTENRIKPQLVIYIFILQILLYIINTL
jgi:preprotein translocase subunit Sec61beta